MDPLASAKCTAPAPDAFVALEMIEICLEELGAGAPRLTVGMIGSAEAETKIDLFPASIYQT